jgi:hypothetical protein
MKTLLICPALRPAVAHLAAHSPLALAQVLGETVIGHWIEHLAALGATEMRVIAPDRPDLVRAELGSGARWGVQIEVLAPGVELTPAEAAARYRAPGEGGWMPPPYHGVAVTHLPGCADLPLFASYAGWFAAGLAWMPRALTPARMRVSEVRPGVWIGRRARVSPKARLIAPCWIGDQAYVGPEAVIGPGAILEDRSFVEAGARISESSVGENTFVGRMSVVRGSLAAGSTLTNWRTGSSLDVPDPFLMCSLSLPIADAASRRASRSVRSAARLATAPVGFLAGWFGRHFSRTTNAKAQADPV